MILIQKPLNLTPSQAPLYVHRRHPSAPPTVVVHPTRTPGLLTLSKPARPPLQRQNQRQTPKPLPKPKSIPVVRASLLTSPADITDANKSGVIGLPATPSPQPRGRGQIKHPRGKAQIQSTSPSHPSVRGKHGRQPSPSAPQSQSHRIPSQAEVVAIFSMNSANLLDPFLDNDSSLSSTPPSPTLPSHPSGKSVNLTERHSPSTHRHFDKGLQTAPISARTPGAFPLDTRDLHSLSLPAANKKRNRKHHRTPSEGVFYMSSDEDLSSGPDGSVLNENVQTLFGLVNTSNSSSKLSPSTFSTPIRSIPPYKRHSAFSNRSLSKEKHSEREVAETVAGYFASSMFQNSPSPEELPDPLLF